MTRQPRPRIFVVALIAGMGALLTADVKFQSTFKALDAGTITFFGKKVAALVISEDNGLRVPAEEALARELTARGMQGVSTYRMAPKEELVNAERAKPWFDRAKVEGIVALRPVSSGTRTTHSPGMWSTANFNTLWGYYGYGWSQAYFPPSTGRETFIVVETTIYSVPKNALIWAAVAETNDPPGLQRFIAELVTATVQEMQKHGLAKAQGK